MTRTYQQEGNGASNSDCTPAVGSNKPAPVTRTNSTDISRTIPTSTTDEISMSWTTPTNEPNSSDWPNGNYQVSINITAMDANITVKHQLHRTNSSCTSQATVLDDTTGVSATGVYSFNNTVDPAAGNATDRAQNRLLGTNSNAHNTRSFTVTLDSNSFITGPWAEAAADIAMIFVNGGAII